METGCNGQHVMPEAIGGPSMPQARSDYVVTM